MLLSWKVEPECGVIVCGIEFEKALMGLSDSTRQAQTESDARVSRGDEWLEDLLSKLFRHADPPIPYPESIMHTP